MAFVRSKKKANGQKYYQVVRNYRERGKHRQEVLCYLGTHNSLEQAMEYARQHETFLWEEAATWRKEAERRKIYLLQNYGKELEGGIPDYRVASSVWEELERDLHREYWHHWNTVQEVRLPWMKWWTHKWELYERILYYHKALGMARRNEQEAEIHQEKLIQMLNIQEKYF